MDYDDGLDPMKGILAAWGYTMTIVVIVLLCLMLFGCKTQYVSVPEYHTEYVYRTDSVTMRDSIYTHDSVWVEKSGDTITTYKTRYVYVDRWRDVLRVDSFIKTDSIRVPMPVERKSTKWESFCIDYGKITLGVSIAAVIAVIIAIIIWIRRKGV